MCYLLRYRIWLSICHFWSHPLDALGVWKLQSFVLGTWFLLSFGALVEKRMHVCALLALCKRGLTTYGLHLDLEYMVFCMRLPHR